MSEKPDVLKVIDIITYNTSLNSGILNITKTNSKPLKNKFLDAIGYLKLIFNNQKKTEKYKQ